MSKHHKTETNGKDAELKRAKRAARLEQARAIAAKLNGCARKKDWKKVAKLLSVDCCDPAKRGCKGCPLEKELKPG